MIRGHKVMLDTALAALYQVATFRLNEAVKRNRERFPKDFMFQLTSVEAELLTSHFAMSKTGRSGRRTLPYARSMELPMHSSVLNTPRAVQMNILIIRAFIKFRELLATHKDLANKNRATRTSTEGTRKATRGGVHHGPASDRAGSSGTET